jgi:hypothetical protein
MKAMGAPEFIRKILVHHAGGCSATKYMISEIYCRIELSFQPPAIGGNPNRFGRRLTADR